MPKPPYCLKPALTGLLTSVCAGLLLWSATTASQLNNPTVKEWPGALEFRATTTHPIIVKPAQPEPGPDYWSSLEMIPPGLNHGQPILLKSVRPMSGGAWVVELDGLSEHSSPQPLFRYWRQQQLIDYAEIDSPVRTSLVPDDPLFDLQWHLGSADDYASLNLPEAWDITRGSAAVTVAIIDTGIRFENSELAGRLLPGYDFVSGINDYRSQPRVPDGLNFIKAHDGDGRDQDASDPGDGVDAELNTRMLDEDLECPQQESTWHGTAMASLVAANGNDSNGMTGVDWEANILPVRAIGKCGGRRSDLLDAIRWAAGVDDPSLPDNPTPARIVNLSLGIDDACTRADQQAIDDAVAAGALIVSAVGNLGRNLDEEPSSPSHCNNVLGVTAVDAKGYRASYSSYGLDADLAAPGGEGPSGDNRPILVATNDGYMEPQPGDSHRYTTGTSVASPLVAGVISLMLSVNPALSNAEIRALLQSSSKPFPDILPSGSASDKAVCDRSTCGSGLVDAGAAVAAALVFNPEDPGNLARAIQENQSVFKSGGSGGAGLWLVLLLTGLFAGRWVSRCCSLKSDQ